MDKSVMNSSNPSLPSPDSTIALSPLPEIPSWMLPSVPVAKLKAQNEATTFENAFGTLLEHVAAGNPLSAAVERDPRNLNYARLLQWIHKDESREARLREAQRLGAEVIEDQMLTISDGSDSAEDVARSTLRINTRKWLLGVWNRKRYGDTKQIEVTSQISITAALEQAKTRLIDVVDVTPKLEDN